MPLSAGNLASTLESYVLSRDVKPSTAEFYRRQFSVFQSWLKLRPCTVITEETISRFLADKQAAKKSSYYRKSLRNGLKAVIGDELDWRKIRPVKLDRLEVRAFTRHEVGLLIRAVLTAMPPAKREFWRLIIPVAYHTGLAQCDLHRLERKHIDAEGVCRFTRSKTGTESVTWLPPYLVEQLGTGPLFPPYASNEMFRRDFQAICRQAGVKGTFKMLRKTSGTEAERIAPGEGHAHLANTRKVFEKHYDARHEKRKPIRLASVRTA